MSIRFVHIADTHLGAGGFGNKLSVNGINKREEDICNAFTYTINKIIELQPDFVIHAGDLFHMVRPTNRIINFAIQEVLKLTQAGIQIVIISGNHDAPKQRSVGHVLSIFENLPDVHTVFRSQYETVHFDGVSIGCLPHCITPDILQEQFENVHPDDDMINILVSHGVAAGIDKFSMAELSEEEIPSSVFQVGFDYVALGHYHKYTEVEERVFYAGSTERLSFGELDEVKGFLEVELPEFKTNFHKIPVREMLQLDTLDAKGLEFDELEKEIDKVLTSVSLEDKIVRFKIINLPDAHYNNLPVRDIKSHTSNAFFFKLIAEREGEKAVHLDEGVKFGRLLDEFNAYLEKRQLENLKREELVRLAEYYFSQAGD
jgi:DNA repair protein SbcD/Mre11